MTRNHSAKSLAVLLRARMHPDPLPSRPRRRSRPLLRPPTPTPPPPCASGSTRPPWPPSRTPRRSTLFSDGYRSLDHGGRREVLRSLATEYDVPRARVRDLMRQYMGLASAAGGDEVEAGPEEGKEGAAASLYRMERGLRDALQPRYSGFLEAMNAQPGGLKLLAVLRADLLALLGEENAPALRALDSYLKEKLVTWLSPAALALHQITWDDPASLLEKIVAYEAVHPIRNLIDLKRRLGVGRRCFGYFHPAIPGEPLIFIEVALLKDMASSIQEVLWDVPPTPESEATCALFYSISSTQTFATLSPIPGFMQWLLAKLASQINEQADGKQGIELLHDLLKSSQWVKSDKISAALKSPLMRLCARYLGREKKRGKALDAVANFHLQNGAMIERINWMADQSEKGIQQSGGIMVNYLYRYVFS
ncbi:hypothetical protein PR202_gb22721 [Eleusine coracana subsp. coracana]|uniref:Malonyl-CoA decarboxylase n=1 Tax=Eleusine coracana subsp. coracana TaxID=191504 RepID=A0AAV5FGW1_ELECO|nr:hypothetical protein PR202_gb22721 [Eleusine coracana subsp. coracana]